MAKRTRDNATGPLGSVGDGSNGAAPGTISGEGSGNGVGGLAAISGVETIDPNTIPEPGSDGTAEPKRKRGRPVGSTNKAQASADIDAVKTLISTFHGIAAIRVPEMAIEDKEVDLLATSLLRAFPKVRSIVNGETMAKIALAGVVLQVYGTRAVAIGARIKKEKTAKEETPENVTVLHPTNTAGMYGPQMQPRN